MIGRQAFNNVLEVRLNSHRTTRIALWMSSVSQVDVWCLCLCTCVCVCAFGCVFVCALVLCHHPQIGRPLLSAWLQKFKSGLKKTSHSNLLPWEEDVSVMCVHVHVCVCVCVCVCVYFDAPQTSFHLATASPASICCLPHTRASGSSTITSRCACNTDSLPSLSRESNVASFAPRHKTFMLCFACCSFPPPHLLPSSLDNTHSSFPLAPFFALANNILEIRVDSSKFVSVTSLSAPAACSLPFLCAFQ